MNVTIKDIAKKAGVHRSTVDKVLHNRVGVSEEVRKRVKEIIEELAYKPNPAGRILQRQGRVYRLAAVLVDVDALPYLKAGIEKGINKQVGFNIDIQYHITKFQDAKSQNQIIDQLIEEKVDGIIISPTYSDLVREAIGRAAEAGIPVVTTNSDIPTAKRMAYVGLDSIQASKVAGRLMGLFLNNAGQIAIISASIENENNNYDVATREQGFVNFISKHYSDLEVVECVEGFEDPQIIYQKTVKLLDKYPNLNGIYITCGGVSEVGRALKESQREKKIKVLSFETYPEIIELMKENVIDCTFSSELSDQGMIPVQILMDYLVFGRKPSKKFNFTVSRILVKENI